MPALLTRIRSINLRLNSIVSNGQFTFLIDDKEVYFSLPPEFARELRDRRQGTLVNLGGFETVSDNHYRAHLAEISKMEEFRFDFKSYAGRQGKLHIFKGSFPLNADGSVQEVATGVCPDLDDIVVKLEGKTAMGLSTLFGAQSSKVSAENVILSLSGMKETSGLVFEPA